MSNSLLDYLRPYPIKGKGYLLNLVTPRTSARTCRISHAGLSMDLNLSNVIHRQIWMGCFAREMTRWLDALLPAGGAFLDVGAHAGYFTLLAAERVGANGCVLAVEPNPIVFEALKNHVASNRLPQVETLPVALSDREGVLNLYLPPVAERRDYNVTICPRPGWEQVSVPARTLDQLLAEREGQRFQLMKIDVEGAESLVLRGGADGLHAGRVSYLMAEVNGPRLQENGSSPQSLVDELASIGFHPARLAGGKATVIDAAAWDLHPDHEHDRLFIHGSVII